MDRYLDRPMSPDEPDLGRVGQRKHLSAHRRIYLTHDVWVSVLRCWSAISMKVSAGCSVFRHVRCIENCASMRLMNELKRLRNMGTQDRQQ